MKYGSVCSGIEAATVAWHPLGWTPAWFAEIEPFPSAVLAHHYQEVQNYGDFTRIRDNDHPADRGIDLLVGGTPCQSFSISGLRGGLDDDRGQLALEFMRLVGTLRPRWVLWENVPGVLSSNGGRDFGSILGALAELGYGFAWRVLDAQHFGVPQRRRRVFLVGHSGGDSRRAAAVLFEPEGVHGNPPSREGARQDTSGSSGDGLARCVTTGEMKRLDWETCSFVAEPVIGFGWQEAIRFKAEEELSGTLTKNQTQAVAFSSKDYGGDATIEQSPTLRSGSHSHSHANGGAPPAVAFSPLQGGRSMPVTPESPTLEAGTGNKSPAVLLGPVVRRLTPVECERLQGFPDNYTAIPWRKKAAADCPDGPRYKALGNSMAVPVMRWIGQRIEMVDKL